MYGPNVWWNDNGRSYIFHDGDHDPEVHPLGPKLHHFRSFTIKDVLRRKRDSWNEIMAKNTIVPARTIAIYSPDGSYLTAKDVSEYPNPHAGTTSTTCISTLNGHPTNLEHTNESSAGKCTD